MIEILKIGKVFYKVENQTKTYWYFGTSPEKLVKKKVNKIKEK
jgi:hypothetical protein